MESKQRLQEIYAGRDKLFCGINGGMPINLQRGSFVKTMLAIAEGGTDCIVLGHGDGVAAAALAYLTGGRVAGVEINPMLRFGFDMDSARLHWDTDILSIRALADISPGTVPVLAYSMDDSVPQAARRHWYRLIEADSRVHRVCTALHRSLDLSFWLPSFRLVQKFRVMLEGGRCSRTMLILSRRGPPTAGR